VYDSASQTLYVAPAASGTRADYLTAVLHPAATVDVVPLAPGDVTGVGIFFYGLPMLLVGMITSIVLLQFPMWPVRKKVATVAATGAFATVVAFAVATTRDVVPPEPWLLVFGFLLTQTIGWLTTALPRLVRQFFMPVAMTFVLILGIPTSGATVNADMLPRALAWLHQVLPFGQFIEAARAVAYFDGHGLARPLTVLVAWAAGAGLLLAWTSRPVIPAPEPIARPAERGELQRVYGTVRATSGVAVAGATVLILDDAGKELVRTSAGADGGYSVDGVQPGLHHLVVTAPHHEPEITSIGVHRHRTEPARDLTLVDWNDPAGNLTAEEIGDRRSLVS